MLATARLLAERRAGELLAGMPKAQGGRPGGENRFHDGTGFQTLTELGIPKVRSHRLQQLAAIPAEAFEAHVEAVKAEGGELTTAGVPVARILGPFEARRARSRCVGQPRAGARSTWRYGSSRSISLTW